MTTSDGWAVWLVRLLITTGMAVGAYFAKLVYEKVGGIDLKIEQKQSAITERLTLTREGWASDKERLHERMNALENRTTRMEQQITNIDRNTERTSTLLERLVKGSE